MRQLSKLDHILTTLDLSMKTLHGIVNASRDNPGDTQADLVMDAEKTAQVIGLMRVNHAGEIAAQALYHGQCLVARSNDLRTNLLKAAEEENDHLAWCASRVQELGGATSYLDPFWYVGSFCIGAVAGLCGDKISLGFLAETEQQVTEHLTHHLQQLPVEDFKSQAIITQMRADEMQHADFALKAGARELPKPIKQCMRLLAKVMTVTANRI